ncbi:MAG: glycosyltransferase [Trichocoleus desertorum ATA4-8-CV12]|jgi:spore maturation protein CgeB|nr:glycosyltransferase [Trichocoleus desertorum ATA4-8-CV12]
MRILKITTAYPAYLKRFYNSYSDLLSTCHHEQKSRLDYDAFGWSDFWSHALTPFGYEMMEVLANAKPLQMSWALERGLEFSLGNWLLDITFEQVKSFQPEILFMEDYSTFSYAWLKEIRQVCPSIKLVMGWCGAPYEDATVFQAYDVVLSCVPELVAQFQRMGHLSEHINHAFDSRLLERIDRYSQPTINFSFIGQIVSNYKYHSERELILEKLVNELAIEIYSPSTFHQWNSELKVLLQNKIYRFMQGLQRIGISQSWLRKLPKIGKFASQGSMPTQIVSPRLRPFIKPAVFGLEMFQTLQNSKITFNNHINISPRSASNMRLFEATGVGTCLVTDWKENLAELFDPDNEVVTYQSADECVEKVEWLLEHPQERVAIAQAGQARTLKDHTFEKRALQLDQIIRKWLL